MLRRDYLYEYQIEWSPNQGLNLRAKWNDEKLWRYGHCDKASQALSLGEALLTPRKRTITDRQNIGFIFKKGV